MPRRYMMLALAILALQACASTDRLSRQMSGWQRQPVDVAVAEWGEPEQRIAFGDQTILVWRDRLEATPGYDSGVQSTPILCERQLAVDAGGTITGWRWRGDSCPTLGDPGARAAYLAAAPR